MEGRHEQRRRPFQQTPRLPYPLGITTPTTHTLAGQKRDNAGYIRGPTQGADLKQSENSKLFVTSIPKNIAEDEVRGVFAEHGNILELALIKDKRTGIQQAYAFDSEFQGAKQEADREVVHRWKTPLRRMVSGLENQIEGSVLLSIQPERKQRELFEFCITKELFLEELQLFKLDLQMKIVNALQV